MSVNFDKDGYTYHGTFTKRMQDAFEYEAVKTGQPVANVLWKVIRAAMHHFEEVRREDSHGTPTA